ncbi:MAG: hypothetical protein WCK49_06840 [Myxococcaceae bacterium]
MNGFLLAAAEPTVFRDVPEAKTFPELSPEATKQFEAIQQSFWDISSEEAFTNHLNFLLKGVVSYGQDRSRN